MMYITSKAFNNICKMDVKKIRSVRDDVGDVIWEICESSEIKRIGRKPAKPVYPTFILAALSLLLRDDVIDDSMKRNLLERKLLYALNTGDMRIDDYIREAMMSVYDVHEDAIGRIVQKVSEDKLLAVLMTPCSDDDQILPLYSAIVDKIQMEQGETVALLTQPSPTASSIIHQYRDGGFDYLTVSLLLKCPQVKCHIYKYNHPFHGRYDKEGKLTSELIAIIRCLILGVDVKIINNITDLAEMPVNRVIDLLPAASNRKDFNKSEVKKRLADSRYSFLAELQKSTQPSWVAKLTPWLVNQDIKQIAINAASVNQKIVVKEFIDRGEIGAVVCNPGQVMLLDRNDNSEVNFIAADMGGQVRTIPFAAVEQRQYSLAIGEYTAQNRKNAKRLCNNGSDKDGIAEISKSVSITSTNRNEAFSAERTKYVTVVLQNRYSSKQYITSSFVERQKKVGLLQNGDIVFSRVGNTTFYMIDWLEEGEYMLTNTSQIGLKIIDKNRFLPEYICLYMNSCHGQKQLEELHTGMSQRSLTINSLSKIYIPSMSIARQRSIVGEYEAILEKKKQLEREEQAFYNSFAQVVGTDDVIDKAPVKKASKTSADTKVPVVVQRLKGRESTLMLQTPEHLRQRQGLFRQGDINNVLLGLGGRGISFINYCLDENIFGDRDIDYMTIDTELNVMKSKLDSNKWFLGSGGNGGGSRSKAEVARRVYREYRQDILDYLKGVQSVIICCGLGGSTGTIVTELVQDLKDTGIATVKVVCSQPFEHEGKVQKQIAAEIGAELQFMLPLGCLMMQSNKDIMDNKGKNISLQDAFEAMNEAMAGQIKYCIL